MGSVAYRLKPEARRDEPPHWIRTHCFAGRKVSIIQNAFIPGVENALFALPAKMRLVRPLILRNGDGYKWLDAAKP